MVDYKLGIMETRFAELIWNREPITSGELVKLCERDGMEKIDNLYHVAPTLPAEYFSKQRWHGDGNPFKARISSTAK